MTNAWKFSFLTDSHRKEYSLLIPLLLAKAHIKILIIINVLKVAMTMETFNLNPSRRS